MATSRKLVVIHDNVILHELGNIGGPVINPVMIPITSIQKLVMNNRKVYECDPKDPRNEKKRVLLTFSNFMRDNFAPKPADAQSTENTGSYQKQKHGKHGKHRANQNINQEKNEKSMSQAAALGSGSIPDEPVPLSDSTNSNVETE